MYLRLGFAIAVHVDADILLIDEILAVGDAENSKKSVKHGCNDATKRGCSAHCLDSLSTLATLCNRVIWLDSGRVMAEGHPAEVLQQYCPTLVLPSA